MNLNNTHKGVIFFALVALSVGFNVFAYADHRTCDDGYREVTDSNLATSTTDGSDLYGSYYLMCSNQPIRIAPAESFFIGKDMVNNGLLEAHDADGLCIGYDHIDSRGQQYSLEETYCVAFYEDESQITYFMYDDIEPYIDLDDVTIIFMKFERNIESSDPVMVSQSVEHIFLTFPRTSVMLSDSDRDGIDDTFEVGRERIV